jgi:hypothetical protein
MKITDFEFRIQLLVSLVETRRVVCYKADDVYEDRNERKKGLEKSGVGLKEGFEAVMLSVCVDSDDAQTT